MRLLKTIYRPLVARMLAFTAKALARLRRSAALSIGDLAGDLAWLFAARERQRALSQLKAALPRMSDRRRLDIARRSARIIGRSLVQTLLLPSLDMKKVESLVDSDSFAPAEAVRKRGKGVIITTGHVGAWEFLGVVLGDRLGRPINAIGRRLYFDAYNDLLVNARKAIGVETIYQDAGARPALRALRENGTLAILGDQDVPRIDGVFVDFFGRPAYTPSGPAAIARASGAGMVPVFITWQGDRHRVHVLPEIELVRTEDRETDVLENTRRWSKVIEDFVRRHPEHWPWFHRRWRTRPSGEKGGG